MNRSGYSGDGGGQLVVGLAGELGGPNRLQLLDAGGGQRQHRHVDTGRVHRCDPTRTDVEQLLEESVGIGFGGIGLVVQTAVAGHRVVRQPREPGIAAKGVHPALGGEMHLEVDLLHRNLPSSVAADRVIWTWSAPLTSHAVPFLHLHQAGVRRHRRGRRGDVPLGVRVFTQPARSVERPGSPKGR